MTYVIWDKGSRQHTAHCYHGILDSGLSSYTGGVTRDIWTPG